MPISLDTEILELEWELNVLVDVDEWAEAQTQLRELKRIRAEEMEQEAGGP